MKKLVMALGYVSLALIVVLAAGMASLAIKGKSLDKESKAFVDAAVPVIVAEWDVKEVRKRASPEFDQLVDYDELSDLFSMLKGLGPLEAYKGSAGDSSITISLQGGHDITADYTANADFGAGSVEIQLSLIRHSGQWQILDLQIIPELFSENKDII